MPQIDRILHPTDFSESAEVALRNAVHLARHFEAEIHLLHVLQVLHSYVEGPLPSAYAGSGSLPDFYSEFQREAEEQLSQMVEQHSAPDVRIKPILSPAASAAPLILEYATEEHADLIVMGTHGRRAVERLLLGSVAEEVVHSSRCNVYVVRATEDDPAPRSIQRILVPVDFSEASAMAVARAKEWADSHGAQLDVLHVIEPLPFTVSLASSVSIYDLDPDIIENTHRELQTFIDGADGPDVPASLHVEEGSVGRTIVEKSEEADVDMIVIASQGRSAIRRFVLGSVTERVLRTARRPVLTVRSEDGT